MNPGDIFASLLKLALDVGKEATAEQKADMIAQLDDARSRLAALPSLAVAVGDAAERRRQELRASIAANTQALRDSAKRDTDPAPPEGE